MVINGAIVSDLDMMYIESVLQVYYHIFYSERPFKYYISLFFWRGGEV